VTRTSQSQPATLNRGVNSRSEPAVPGPRNEMLSPKGGHGGDRPSDRVSDEEQAGESSNGHPGMQGQPGRPLNNLGPCQAPRPTQQGQSKLPSRATVGGAPLASDMRRPEAVANNTAGARPGQQFGVRGRDPRSEIGRSEIGSRMPQAAPFSAGGPPPVSGRGGGGLDRQRLETTNGNRIAGTGGQLSALDSSRSGPQGAQLRVSTEPLSGSTTGAHTRTPPVSSAHTPRPHAYPSGSLGANRPGAGVPHAPQTGFTQYGVYGNSPARSSGVTVSRGVPVPRR